MSVVLAVAVLHAVAALAMAGLIWFVQVVHYPLLGAVGDDAFVAYERLHVRRTGAVVGPVMLTEAATAVGLAALADGPAALAAAWLGLALLAGVWASTWMLQVPCHARLEQGFDAAAWRRLVATNWIRTALWTVRVPVAIALVGAALGGTGP